MGWHALSQLCGNPVKGGCTSTLQLRTSCRFRDTDWLPQVTHRALPAWESDSGPLPLGPRFVILQAAALHSPRRRHWMYTPHLFSLPCHHLLKAPLFFQFLVRIAFCHVVQDFISLKAKVFVVSLVSSAGPHVSLTENFMEWGSAGAAAEYIMWGCLPLPKHYDKHVESLVNFPDALLINPYLETNGASKTHGYAFRVETWRLMMYSFIFTNSGAESLLLGRLVVFMMSS